MIIQPSERRPWTDGPRPGAMGVVSGMHIDWPLFIGLALLCTVGLVVLYSASGQDWSVVRAQGIRLAMGMTLMMVVAQIRPHHIEFWTPWLFAAGVLLLVAVLVAGDVGKGAQRWLDLGVIRFQPSEIMKVAVPLMVAWYLSAKALPPTFFRLLMAALIIVVPVLLIAKQPDLGTSILVAAAGVFVLFLTGLSWKLIISIGTLIAGAAPVAWLYLLHDYQKQRILTFLNPESDPLGTGYHITQSKIAIGSGGLYGKGWLNGTQSQLEYIPERSTDFIFAVFSEEFGLIGMIFLTALYLFIVMRGLRIAHLAQDTFSRLVAGSLILTYMVYVVVNMGMVSGLLPVVGVPLPMLSYGGTAVVTLMVGFGILMSIQTHRKLLPSG